MADLWRQIITKPSMGDYVKKLDMLSFHIGSRLPVPVSLRQELLDIDGISYRLQREIQILKEFNLVRCKNCLVNDFFIFILFFALVPDHNLTFFI
jgi:cereblon